MPRKAPMPESVKIGPWVYAIECDPGKHLTAEDHMSARLNGLSNASRGVINIDPGSVVDFQRSTMLHEIFHQVFEVAGWHTETEVEEQVCRTLETVFLGTLRDNPDLVRWLTAVQ